jgi:hypothetical protein
MSPNWKLGKLEEYWSPIVIWRKLDCLTSDFSDKRLNMVIGAQTYAWDLVAQPLYTSFTIPLCWCQPGRP